MRKGIYFTDVFEVDPKKLARYGAFNVSPWTDMPLFIDPFLLFASNKSIYQKLHREIIEYLKFLRNESSKSETLDKGKLQHLYCFKEVSQNCLGFAVEGTKGLRLGSSFGIALHKSLHHLFGDFGAESITEASHVEKLSLIQKGVGRDKISDLTTNLIKGYLLRYTETFAKKNIAEKFLGKFSVSKSSFNYELGTWGSATFILPKCGKNYVLLTPEDLLAQDDTWINKEDLRKDFSHIRESIDNVELRERVSSYFQGKLPKRTRKDREGRIEFIPPTASEQNRAIQETIQKYPQLIDYFIKSKENRKEQAVLRAGSEVESVKGQLVDCIKELIQVLSEHSEFFTTPSNSYSESVKKIGHFKHVIENCDGYKAFYHNGLPLKMESKFQAMFKMVWSETEYNFDSEVNNGRGPVDFKVSKGRDDQTLIEFKLASNSSLRANLDNQVEVYKMANRATQSLTVVIYFDKQELEKIEKILPDLDEAKKAGIILIDARADNKPSGSKAKKS